MKEENAITEELSQWQNSASELKMMGEGEGREYGGEDRTAGKHHEESG